MFAMSAHSAHESPLWPDPPVRSNGGTEATNMPIEKARRLAHGYHNLDKYWFRMLLAATGTRTGRTASPR